MNLFKEWFLNKKSSFNSVKIGGFVRVYKVDGKTHKRVFIREYQNVTTTTYKTRILKKIISASNTDNIIPATIEIGTGVNTASASDTSLQTLLLSKPFTNTPVIVGSQIIYEIKLETGEANTLITEIGLKTGDNLLIARVNVSIPKTSQDVLVIQWTKSVI